MQRDRNWAAERLVDGGKRCTVLPALRNIDVSVSGAVRQVDTEDESDEDKVTPPAVLRQKQQQSFVERMHRGRDRSVKSHSPPDILDEVRQLISPRPPNGAYQSPQRSSRGPERSNNLGAASNPGLHFLPCARQEKQTPSLVPQQFPAAIARALNLPFGDHRGADGGIRFTKPKRRTADPHELFNSVIPKDEWSVVRRRAPDLSKKCTPRLAPITKLPSARLHEDSTGGREVAEVAARASTSTINPHQTQSKRSVTPDMLSSNQRQSKKPEILERISPEDNVPLERRYACEGLRALAFGRLENVCDHQGRASIKLGNADSKERNNIFQEGVGTKEEVLHLFKFWLKLDSDRSGRMELTELQEYVHRRGAPAAQKKAGDKVIALLVSRSCKSFSLEDVIRIVWPASTVAQLKQMESWIAEYLAYESLVVSEPLLLSEDEREALIMNFKHVSSMTALEQNKFLLDLPDAAARTVKFDALIKGSVLDKGEAEKCCEIWSRGWTDEISLEEFLMMMCPAGFRAFQDASAAVNDNGDVIILKDGCWRLTKSPHASRATSRSGSQIGGQSTARSSSRCGRMRPNRSRSRRHSEFSGDSRCSSRLSDVSIS